jgi:hypothetical protein
MAMILDLPPSDIIVRGNDSQDGVAKILSPDTVADRPDPLISRRREGPVIDASLGSGPRVFLFSSITSSSHLHHRYSSQLLSLNFFIMSEPPSLRMKQIDDELDETPSPCPKEGPFQRLGTHFMSAISRSGAGSPHTALSHRGDSVVTPTMPGTFPGSRQPQQDQTADGEPGQSEEGRPELHETSGHAQSGSGVRERFDKHGSDGEGDADDYSPPWPRAETPPPLCPYNAVACFRYYQACTRKDSTSYSQTAGTERPDKTEADA